MNEWQQDVILESIAEGEECTPLLEKAFSICALHGDPWFIIADGQDDCSVYFLDDSRTIKEFSKSVMDWIEEFVEQVEYLIRRGLS
ncbi:hypothetical protein [uncultured Nostoc sp.]|uniref:hypothetical protein n=1 Tax=uncultured Nostoc sp. TaxID=340711 RepID=UPI0035CBC384